MTLFDLRSLNGWLRLCAIVAGLAAGQGHSHAENARVELYLVWGTNAEKSSDPSHKPLPDDLGNELRKMCKWQNYFVINRTNVTLLKQEPRKTEMSKKCVIEMKLLEGQRLEVQLIGEGIKRDKVIKPLSKKKSITFAGQDKNDTAWFVIIKQTE